MQNHIPKENRERRAKLAEDVQRFLDEGNQIEEVPFGYLAQPFGKKRPRNADHRKGVTTNGVPMTIKPGQPRHWRSPPGR
jgi:hypothetical protein